MVKVLIVVAAFVLVSCGGEVETDPGEATAQPVEGDASVEPCSPDGNEMHVDASCIDPWPLTVGDGVLRCQPPDSVTIVADGTSYAVNGMASTQGHGVEIDPIWLDNPDLAGTKINIGPMINAGLALC